MKEKSMGFIGGGRVARIILGGLKKAGRMPVRIVASDTNPDVLKRLQSELPDIQVVLNNNGEAAAQDLVFLGLYPPAIIGSLTEIRGCLKPEAVLISLAPKLTIARLKDGLGGFNRIVRLIPNAASIIGEGYNPIVFSETLNRQEKDGIQALLTALGKCPEVAEAKLEAYAIVMQNSWGKISRWALTGSVSSQYSTNGNAAKKDPRKPDLGGINVLRNVNSVIFCFLGGFNDFFHVGSGGRSLLCSHVIGGFSTFLCGCGYKPGPHHGRFAFLHAYLCKGPDAGLEAGTVD